MSELKKTTERTWIVKAIDVTMRDAHMPFWALEREVQAVTRAEAIEKAKARLHSGCFVKSASPKRTV